MKRLKNNEMFLCFLSFFYFFRIQFYILHPVWNDSSLLFWLQLFFFLLFSISFKRDRILFYFKKKKKNKPRYLPTNELQASRDNVASNTKFFLCYVSQCIIVRQHPANISIKINKYQKSPHLLPKIK